MEVSAQKSLAIAELEPIVMDVAAFTGTLESLDVTDEETQGHVGDLKKMMNHRRNKLEDKRKSLVNPLNQVVKDINDLFRPTREKIEALILLATKKMDRFAQAQQTIADEKAKIAREDAERERREAQDLARKLQEKAGVEEAAAVVVQLELVADRNVEKAAAPAKVAVTRGVESSVSVKKTWTAEITDIVALALAVGEGRLPAHFIEPNMQALKDFAREMGETREHNGVKYYQAVSTSVR